MITLIGQAKEAWQQVGDCELKDWKCKHLAFSKVVTAVGYPPRCKRLYRHVFVFHEGSNRDPRLKSILRDVVTRKIDWMTNGQATQPRQQYQYFEESLAPGT